MAITDTTTMSYAQLVEHLNAQDLPTVGRVKFDAKGRAIPPPGGFRAGELLDAQRAYAARTASAPTSASASSTARTTTKVRPASASTARTPGKVKPAPIADTELRRQVAHNARKLRALESSLPAWRKSAAQVERDNRERAAVQARDEAAFDRAFGIATRRGVRREGSSVIFEVHNPRGNRLADALEPVERETHAAVRNPQTPAPPSSVKSADELAFDRAFPTGKPPTNSFRREGTSLSFDARAFAKAHQEKMSRVAWALGAYDDWPTSPPPPEPPVEPEPEPEDVDDDEAAFDRAFGGTVGDGNAGIKREGTSLIFDVAATAHAARERFARQHG